MPKPTGYTKKGKLIRWLKKNPGQYRTRQLMRQHNLKRSVVLSALTELECNNAAVRACRGKNTYWIINSIISLRGPDKTRRRE